MLVTAMGVWVSMGAVVCVCVCVEDWVVLDLRSPYTLVRVNRQQCDVAGMGGWVGGSGGGGGGYQTLGSAACRTEAPHIRLHCSPLRRRVLNKTWLSLPPT